MSFRIIGVRITRVKLYYQTYAHVEKIIAATSHFQYGGTYTKFINQFTNLKTETK